VNLLRLITFLILSWVSMLSAAETSIRIGLTPVFLDDQPSILKAWRGYLERRLNRRVTFVQRGSYREITDLLMRGDLEVAWLCGLPYIERQEQLSLVATPVYKGAPLYRSYLITSADGKIASWRDLAGGVFAYSDPDSNSGYLYPSYSMRQERLDPDALFRKSFFAKGHRNVVAAVASGLADAGAVDGYIWDTLARDKPELTRQTKVIERSETFGFPPLVARNDYPQQEVSALRSALMDMQASDDGRAVLKLLNIDGFIVTEPALYQRIADMARAVGRLP
jgi:phosphonate transport system substrate-binding protein